jgi:tetratricopeptide (TPR) repeat protein
MSSEAITFQIIARPSDQLIIVLAPMNLAIDRLPHYKSTDFDDFSVLLLNPGNCNFYRDCILEVVDLIKSAIEETNAKRLTFCGSSMGAYGALYFGSLFEQTRYIVGYAPFLRLDHPASLSKMAMRADLIADEDQQFLELVQRLKESTAEIYLFHPCIDRQDGIHIADSELLQEFSHVRRYHLLCEHDIHRYISLTKMVSNIVHFSNILEKDVSHLLCNEFEISLSKMIYCLYLDESLGKTTDFNLSPVPIENSKNWIYFYWKARNLYRRGDLWSSLSNFMIAMSYGGSNFSETHFCIANVFKDLGLRNAAIGHYQEAYKLDSNNSNISKTICSLLIQ